ncbi:glycoside hydrolase family 65 protein [Phytohabitans houttuyneae]|uniref:Trehalose 6-phosphate phosphorylase n=1 Tax=Phytohabitans houttuyneae TaxID=1076126 RepID=A0A6V8KJX3_9ACTN|nr:glycosyl hydrolase family 65 protein [Phytohabitans houttuyneae]GFJ80975.1 trehalose 6-phosphate phosphorylase [Phytohabitans houttuyneae]
MRTVNAWTLSYDGFDPAEEGLREALCTLGNGYLATRGSAPESRADGVHYPGTYAAGVYNRLADTVDGRTVENESLVNLPDWLPLTFAAVGGEWCADAEGLDQWLELDLRRGVLTRRWRVRDAAGRTTTVTQRRFVHMRHEHLCGLQTTFTPENWSGRLRVRSSLDITARNLGVVRYRGLADAHLRSLSAEPVDAQRLLVVVATTQSHIRMAEALRTSVLRSGAQLDVPREVVREAGRLGHELIVDVTAGEPVTVEKLVAVYTSRDRAISDPATAALDRLAWAGDFDDLLAEHVLAWRQLWRRFRVSLRGTDHGALGTVRLHLFHLLQTMSPHSADLDAGVPARGLHGEAYRGHVLWDELFVFPILNLRTPHLSRALLRYRYRRLPEARRAAREAGYAGAMYPWQSGSDGREESQRLHLNPMSGRWVADPTHLQRHVGLAVAYNVWQYYQVTGDRVFLDEYGAEMIIEVARFFADLATFDRVKDRYIIRGVMGPDEFHTGYPDAPDRGVDNNAYTNVLTAWVMRRALDTLQLLPDGRRIELAESLGLRTEEPERWEEISRRMYVPMHDSVISQFEGYERLAEFDWDGYRSRYSDIRRLDRILESEGDSPNRYQLSKQADVLMLLYLFSADELAELFARLGYRLEPHTIDRTVEYYVRRTTHGSTLSAVVHAWVLARNHREQALKYFLEALRSDVADVQGGTTAEGVHLAAMAGSVDVLQRCFAGIETRDDALWLNPYWPPTLGTFDFDMRYREHPLTLRISGAGIQVTAGAGQQPPVRVCCRGQSVLLHPGQAVEFPEPAL